MFKKKNVTATGIPDLDRDIMLRIDDRELLELCNGNKYMRNTVCNENFWRMRTKRAMGDVVKPDGMTWKNYYLSQLL